jgi:NADH:ubiquinone oxidoreductase subunit 3 (subunit A)
MPVDQTVPIISHAIQLAVAPVFLLTGVATLLGVMATRLARIIDRARVIEEKWPEFDPGERADGRAEMHNLERRRHWASWSINFCTCAALLVCIVISTLFVEAFFGVDMKSLAGALFVAVMAALIGGLACFAREVYLATLTLQFDVSKFDE